MRYRYEEHMTEEGVKLTLREFAEIKKTKCGAWVLEKCWWPGRKRFVLDGVGKRYCHENKNIAYDSYKIRKKLQARHAQNALDIASFMLIETANIKEAPECTINLGQPEFWEAYSFD